MITKCCVSGDHTKEHDIRSTRARIGREGRSEGNQEPAREEGARQECRGLQLDEQGTIKKVAAAAVIGVRPSIWPAAQPKPRRANEGPITMYGLFFSLRATIRPGQVQPKREELNSQRNGEPGYSMYKYLCRSTASWLSLGSLLVLASVFTANASWRRKTTGVPDQGGWTSQGTLAAGCELSCSSSGGPGQPGRGLPGRSRTLLSPSVRSILRAACRGRRHGNGAEREGHLQALQKELHSFRRGRRIAYMYLSGTPSYIAV